MTPRKKGNCRMILAPDTNLLLYPTPRTLLHAIAIEQGHEILVLPEVYDEVMRGIRITQAEKAQDIFKGLSNLGSDRESEIAERMIASAQDWFTSELEHEDTAYRRAEQTWQQAANAARIVRALPSGIAAPMPEPPSGDPLILAQALVHEATLLSTNNLNTIDHEQANAWARKPLARPRPVYDGCRSNCLSAAMLLSFVPWQRTRFRNTLFIINFSLLPCPLANKTTPLGPCTNAAPCDALTSWP